MPSGHEYMHLTDHCVLKNLEVPYLYDLKSDDLYELSPDAYTFLCRCSCGEAPSVRKEDEEFLQFCLSEDLITTSGRPVIRDMVTNRSPAPSLRYLELQITDRCNLRCRHCYIGGGLDQDLPIEKVKRLFDEFEEIQGLRMLVSGGEPLLHPQFWEIHALLKDRAFRSILLSNGTLITRDTARSLHVHEVQISLDGMKKGHESVRGRGTYEKTLSAIDCLQESGIRVSIATMIHRGNVKEFDQLASFIQSKGIEEWNIDLPCIKGRLVQHQELWVPAAEAARFLEYGFGGGWHTTSLENASCGAHLCAILPDGRVSKCGVFNEEPVGSIDEGLRVCWQWVPHIPLLDLRCNCLEKDACRGGCRYRAKLQGDLLGPDFFQCYARGALKGGEKDEYQKGS